MPMSPETIATLARNLQEDGITQKSLDVFLETMAGSLGSDALVIDLIREKVLAEKARDIVQAQQVWFDALGWYLARLFMWGGLGCGILSILLWGRAAADPFTFGMAGAAVYYVLIQVFTPWRLARERSHLEALRAERLRELVVRIEALAQSSAGRT